MRFVVLSVGNDPAVRESLRVACGTGHDLVAADGMAAAIQLLRRHPVCCAVIDTHLPDASGLDLLRQVKRFDPGIDVIMVAAERDVETALAAMKSGAYDFLGKPFPSEVLKAALARLRERRDITRENRLLREEVRDSDRPDVYPGSSPASQRLARQIAEAGAASGPVLIRGEVGTEKEAVAREIHRVASGGHRPFAVVSGSVHNREALEADLFGRRESSRGRGVSHPGKMEFAEGGSLFLDHADRMPVETQSRLFQAFSSSAGAAPDVRILASCTPDPLPHTRWNKPWEAFLSRRVIEIPPLRERSCDIPGLIERHLRRVGTISRTPIKGLTREALQFLMSYPWPGNVRELENTVEIMSLTAEHGTLGVEDLPMDVLIRQVDGERGREEARLSLKKARRRFERQYIRKVLEGTRGNQTRAAETLGLHRNTLLWKLRDLQMRDDYRDILEKKRGRAGKASGTRSKS